MDDLNNMIPMDGELTDGQSEGASGNAEAPDTPRVKKQYKQKIQANLKGKNIEEILNLAQRQLRNDLSKYSIDSIPVEHRMIRELEDMSPIMQKWVERGDSIIKTYHEFSDDIVLALYKNQPEMVHPDDMHPSYKINHNLVDEITSDPQFDVLKDYCTMDLFSSAVASEILHDKAIKRLDELREEFKQNGGDNIFDAINDAIANEEEIQALIDKAKVAHQLQQQLAQAGQANNQLNQITNQTLLDLASAMKIANAHKSRLEKVIQNSPDQLQKVQDAMKEGLSEAINTVSEVQKYIQAWGFESGESIRVPFQSKMTAVKKLMQSRKLKKFTDVIGAMKELAMKEQKSKSRIGALEIDSVTTGDDVFKALPSERMMLNNNASKFLLYKKMYEGSLLQYRTISTEKKGRGPIVVCVDISGSMDGTPEIWAKSFAVALLHVAQTQKRNYCYISFESKVRDVFIQEKGYLDPAAVVDICERSCIGGTNFEEPLKKALEVLKDSRFRKGDIVFVTDGNCSISEDFLRDFKKVKEDKEFFVRSIIINTNNWASDESVKLFSDEIIPISSLADLKNGEEAATQVFRGIGDDE